MPWGAPVFLESNSMQQCRSAIFEYAAVAPSRKKSISLLPVGPFAPNAIKSGIKEGRPQGLRSGGYAVVIADPGGFFVITFIDCL